MHNRFTTGPWQNDATGKYYQAHVIRHNGVVIARVLNANSQEECNANARLITAAPDLLERLQDVKANWDAWDGKIDGASVCMAATMAQVETLLAAVQS